MISTESRYEVVGTERPAASVRMSQALDPTWILGGEVCPQHDRTAALVSMPPASARLRGVSGTAPSMKINKFESQFVRGSRPWSSPV